MNTTVIEPSRVLAVTSEYNPQVYACDLENLLAESGVDLLYGTVVCDRRQNKPPYC